MALVTTKTSEGEKNVALSFSLNLWILLAISHATLWAHRSCFEGFFLRSVVTCWSIGATLVRNRMLNNTLGWTLSFLESTCGVMYLLSVARCTSVPKISRPSVNSTWISAALSPRTHNLIAWSSSMSLYHQSSLVTCWADLSTSLRIKTHFFTEFAPKSYDGFVEFPLRFFNLCTVFGLPFQKDGFWEIPSFCVCGFGARVDDCVAFPRLFSSWRKLQAFPFVHCPLDFQLLFQFFRFWPQNFVLRSFHLYVSLPCMVFNF